MGGLHGIVLEAQTRFAQQFGCEGEVALGTGDVNVPEIGCQLRQQALDIRPAAVPGNEPVDCGGVPTMSLKT